MATQLQTATWMSTHRPHPSAAAALLGRCRQMRCAKLLSAAEGSVPAVLQLQPPLVRPAPPQIAPLSLRLNASAVVSVVVLLLPMIPSRCSGNTRERSRRKLWHAPLLPVPPVLPMMPTLLSRLNMSSLGCLTWLHPPTLMTPVQGHWNSCPMT